METHNIQPLELVNQQINYCHANVSLHQQHNILQGNSLYLFKNFTIAYFKSTQHIYNGNYKQSTKNLIVIFSQDIHT